MTELSIKSLSAFTEILTSIEELKNQIDSSAPVGELLIRIHKDLYEKPECFALMTDDEISTIVKGIQKHTKIELIVGKSKPTLKKKFSEDDLI